MRFLQIHTFYPQYLESLYSRFKFLHKASFQEQIDVLVSDAFSAVHMIAPYMTQAGYESRLIIANCHQAQIQWLKENSSYRLDSENWVEEIARKQVEEFEPDILYLSHPVEFDDRFVLKLSHKPKLVLGWRAATFPHYIKWSSFDVMLSSLMPLLDLAVQRGARHGELFLPGFPVPIAERVKDTRASKDIVFVGQYTPTQHSKRGYYLREIAKTAMSKGYECTLHLAGQGDIPDLLNPFLAPPVFGLEMHRALRQGRIAFDARADHFIVDPERKSRVDLGGQDTANMRIFEATGSGTFLLTEHYPNIMKHFEVCKEIETFSDRKELLDKIGHYLAHPVEREEIARRGQIRCLQDHSMEHRAKWLDQIIRRHLQLKLQNNCNKSDNRIMDHKQVCHPKDKDVNDGNMPKKISNMNSEAKVALNMDMNSKPVYRGSMNDALPLLKQLITTYPRRKKGFVDIDGFKLAFSDLHSFYYELDQIFANKLYGFQTESSCPVIIDCGAHIGLASLYFAKRFPHAEIHSFEADPDIFALLASNISSAGLTNVKIYPKAAWTHDVGVNFFKTGDDSGHIVENAANEYVPSVRLMDFIAGFYRIDLLKLDVEGAEFDILEDCLPVLNRVQRMIIEVHRLTNDNKSFANLLRNLEKSGFHYVLSDLHTATWTNADHMPPFEFVTHDKFIVTVFAWQPVVYKKKNNSRASRHKGKPTIAQFCMQDYGGAGTAALRLHDGLLSTNMNSIFYVHNIQRWRLGTFPIIAKNNSASIPHKKIVSTDWRAFQARNQRVISKYPQRPQGLEIFTDTWAATKLSENPQIAKADIIHLHWIAGTVDIPREVEFLKFKKIVWTLHDMNAFTGGCHYSADCQKYEQQCGSCPQLGSNRDNDLSRQVLTRKKAAYRQLDMIIVTPSQWLADCAKKSTLLSSFPVHVIPYGLPTDIFKPYPQPQIRNSLDVPKDVFMILFGADSVTNARKGFVHLLRALEHMKTLDSKVQIALATFGHHAQAAVHHLGFPTFVFDYVDKESELALVYSMADVTVIPSLEDNLPNVVLESLACGTPVVGFDVGGIPDMVDHQVNGYLAQVGDDKGLSEGLRWVMEQKLARSNIRLKCRETALSRYNLPLQAERYQELYEEILK